MSLLEYLSFNKRNFKIPRSNKKIIIPSTSKCYNRSIIDPSQFPNHGSCPNESQYSDIAANHNLYCELK